MNPNLKLCLSLFFWLQEIMSLVLEKQYENRSMNIVEMWDFLMIGTGYFMNLFVTVLKMDASMVVMR